MSYPSRSCCRTYTRSGPVTMRKPAPRFLAVLLWILASSTCALGQHCDADDCQEFAVEEKSGEVGPSARPGIRSVFSDIVSVAKDGLSLVLTSGWNIFKKTAAWATDQATKIAYKVWQVLFDETSGLLNPYRSESK